MQAGDVVSGEDKISFNRFEQAGKIFKDFVFSKTLKSAGNWKVDGDILYRKLFFEDKETKSFDKGWLVFEFERGTDILKRAYATSQSGDSLGESYSLEFSPQKQRLNGYSLNSLSAFG